MKKLWIVVGSIVVLIINTVVDVLYMVLNPKLRIA